MERARTRRAFLSGMVATGGTTALAGDAAAASDPPESREVGADRPPARSSPADAPRQRVLLDHGRERLGSVEIRGETYTAYRYENPIPGAAGIDIYRDGRRVTDEATARAVLSTVVWSFLLERMLEREARLREQFGAILDVTRRMETILGPPRRVLGEVDRRIQQLKNIAIKTPVENISLWDVATRSFPSLRVLAQGVQRTNDLVAKLLEASRRANDALPALESFLAEVEDPQSVPADRAKARVRPAEQSITTLHRTASDLVAEVESLESTARDLLDTIDRFDEELASAIEEEFGGVVDIPDGLLSRVTGRFVEGLRTLLDEVVRRVVDPILDPVREFRKTLAETQSTIGTGGTRDAEAAIVAAWQRRRDAALVADVATAGGTFLGALLLVNTWREPLVEE